MAELFDAVSAARWIAVPGEDDHKYSRGVVGFATGSARYPGAAVLGVDAAMRTGVGMIRYLGPRRAEDLVLARRPEAVPGAGRVQAWVVGSGMDGDSLGDEERARIALAFDSSAPVVLDGGALPSIADARGSVVATPHALELARMRGTGRDDILAEPRAAALDAARATGATILLKGHTTFVASPNGRLFSVRSAPAWLATAGAGDALAGILGALLATHVDEIDRDPDVLAELAATAAVVHGLAAARAAAGGPLTILGLIECIPAVIARLVGGSDTAEAPPRCP